MQIQDYAQPFNKYNTAPLIDVNGVSSNKCDFFQEFYYF